MKRQKSAKQYGLMDGMMRGSIGGPDMPIKSTQSMSSQRTPSSKRKIFANALRKQKK